MRTLSMQLLSVGAVTAALLSPAATAAQEATTRIAEVGFRAPECVRYDTASDVYLVANVNGDPTAKDGNGFISRVAPDGRVLALRWIDSGRGGAELNAPKGMAFRGDTLLVADLDVVRLFHRRTGEPLGAWRVPGATFLNDVAVATDGSVYVTDTGFRSGSKGMEPSGTDAVYRFGPTGEARRVAAGRELGNPNGVAPAADGEVIVASVGSGEVYRLTPSGARTALPKPPKGGLDGLVALPDGTLLVSSWEGEAVYRLRPGQTAWEEVLADVPAPAAIGYDTLRDRLLVPQLTKDEVRVHEMGG